MMKKETKAISSDDFLKLLGLVTVARQHKEQVERMQEAIRRTLGITDPYHSGHLDDLIWDSSDFSVELFREKLGYEGFVEVPPTPPTGGE